MKVTLQNLEKEKKFQPFKLEIEFETLEEATTLLHRINCCDPDRIQKVSGLPISDTFYKDTTSLWYILFHELKKQGFIS